MVDEAGAAGLPQPTTRLQQMGHITLAAQVAIAVVVGAGLILAGAVTVGTAAGMMMLLPVLSLQLCPLLHWQSLPVLPVPSLLAGPLLCRPLLQPPAAARAQAVAAARVPVLAPPSRTVSHALPVLLTRVPRLPHQRLPAPVPR